LGLDGEEAGPPPEVDLAAEHHTSNLLRTLIEQGLVHAVHDISDGGMACTTAEMALASDKQVTLMAGTENALQACFRESQGVALCASSMENVDQIMDLASSANVPARHIGHFSSETFEEGPGVFITFEDLEKGHFVSLARLREAHEGWLPAYMSAID
jgi:phosphoribosylformylglycinamidine synthase